MYMGSSHWKEYTVTSFPALAIVDTIDYAVRVGVPVIRIEG